MALDDQRYAFLGCTSVFAQVKISLVTVNAVVQKPYPFLLAFFMLNLYVSSISGVEGNAFPHFKLAFISKPR